MGEGGVRASSGGAKPGRAWLLVGVACAGAIGCAAPQEEAAEKQTSPLAATACASVVHLGDSLTTGTGDLDNLPALTSAYRAVGVKRITILAKGGRAINYRLPAPKDTQNGAEAARSVSRADKPDCWVVALGTNEAATLAKRGVLTEKEARDSVADMMNAIHSVDANAKVLWVNTYARNNVDGYPELDQANFELWNRALAAARDASGDPRMRVFDWYAVVRHWTEWSSTTTLGWTEGAAHPWQDTLHHTVAGYGVRNAYIANALVNAFPRAENER